jgi:GTP diphosphokinase / guanosine-3',5'-bis(diphosphate) 3'-diphosphatase
MPGGYEKLKETIIKYDPGYDRARLDKAFEIAFSGHKGQIRKSGDPFIVHPVEVAKILAEMEMDLDTIIAGLLHDTIEDTRMTYEELRQQMGTEVADLVDGVTKLSMITFSTKEERQAENLRKMLIAMAKDIRVILIKLADRLHNMRTLKYMPEEKQLDKAQETMEIYAPLAHRLGMSRIKWELEDLSFRYIDPKGYYDLVEKIAVKRREREEYIEKIKSELLQKASEMNIDITVDGRPKHFYSIYKKMKEQNRTIDQIYDLIAIRVIVNSIKDCYSILGMVHEMYKPIPGRFKDYIAMPKPNQYQSLHSTVIGPQGIAFEIQIRTREMHRIAEVGIAAHWKYKENKQDTSIDDAKFAWLRQLLDWHKEMGDDSEFMESVKIDLFSDEVFVFTPKGDVINLPSGSTPIDFAYTIHSAVGNKMIGAKVNGRIVQLDYVLSNGERVEILTSGSVHGPSRDWLNIAKSSQAKSKIKQWFKKEMREENIEKGHELVEKELKKQDFTQAQLFQPNWINAVLKRYNFQVVDDMYSAIGFGGLTALKVIARLKEEYLKNAPAEEREKILLNKAREKKSPDKDRKQSDSGIRVKGVDNCLVRLSKCCNPVPGDYIVGYITRGGGVSVHRTDCTNMKNIIDGENRLIEVTWSDNIGKTFIAKITVKAFDRKQLLMDMANTIGESRISLKGINTRSNKDNVVIIELSLEINSIAELEDIIKKLRSIKNVFEITRENR